MYIITVIYLRKNYYYYLHKKIIIITNILLYSVIHFKLGTQIFSQLLFIDFLYYTFFISQIQFTYTNIECILYIHL